LKTTGAALIGGVLAPSLSLTSRVYGENSDTLRLGLIGCGGRGSGAAIQALTADKNVVLTAMGDAFENRLQDSLANFKKERPDQVKVAPDHCFVGFDAYQKVLASGVDVVILATPPGFRPIHLKAAVEAGKHIFCEKPMAVDAPGVRSVMESAKLAKEKKLSLVSGFCWRYNFAEREGMKRIHDGEIGDVRAVYSTYNTGSLWCYPRKPEWTDMEAQMRNWYYFTWICGDFIVEQACHSIDKMIWAMGDAAPLKAVAHGGRQVRTGKDFGHIFDHFSVVYEFPKGAKGFLFCRQQANCSDDNTDTILGTKGTARILGFAGGPEITGENKWKFSGKRPNMYQIEHDELFASIRAGKPMNDGAWMAQSTMTAILGRMAAYTGKSITWDEALNSKEDLSPAKYAWDQPMSTPPVAMPGITPFI
jgi:predicted dehydrogenase